MQRINANASTDLPASPLPPLSPARRRACDLRFNRTQKVATDLAARLPYLSRGDAALLEQVYLKGVPVAKLAALVRQPARTLRRRTKALAARVLDPAFPYIATRSEHWPVPMRLLAREVFLNGNSVRSAARTARINYHTACVIARMIHALALEAHSLTAGSTRRSSHSTREQEAA